MAPRFHANQCTTDTPLPLDCSNSTWRINLPGTDVLRETPHPRRRVGDGRIEIRAKTAARRRYRADIQRLTARGMDESRKAWCSRCESGISLPYWMRTPTTVRITSPP